jgi:hypothetical protein
MTEILDFVIIFLMVVAIVYGFILNRKIVLIQNSKKELANLFKSFDNTILKAQIGIDDLKKVSNEASHLLQQKLDKAAFVIDDLSFLNEKAVEIYSNLEKSVATSKKTAIASEEKVYNAEVIRNMKQAAEKQNNASSAPATNSIAGNAKKTKMLETLLEKISEKKSSKEKISNDNANRYSAADAAKQDKMNEKVVADMLKAMGYGE